MTAAISSRDGAEGLLDGFDRIEGQGDGGIGEARGDALRIRDPEGGHARAGLDEQGIDVAVIAAFELDDEVAAGEAAGQADRGHGGFGAGVDQAHHFDGRDGIADGCGELDFGFGGRAETGADVERSVDGGEDLGMAVAEQQRAPGADVVDVLVAVDVEEVRAFAAGDEHGGCRRRCERRERAN